MKFDILSTIWKSVEKIQASLKSDKNGLWWFESLGTIRKATKTYISCIMSVCARFSHTSTGLIIGRIIMNY